MRLGWPTSKIEVLDDDQGRSGQVSTLREAFKYVVGEVSIGQGGIVVGLDVSRLARNNADWFPLIEMCALTGTLVADEEGVYEPNDPDDWLVLGIKGTLSEAEVVRMKGRLHGARWSLCVVASCVAGSRQDTRGTRWDGSFWIRMSGCGRQSAICSCDSNKSAAAAWCGCKLLTGRLIVPSPGLAEPLGRPSQVESCLACVMLEGR